MYILLTILLSSHIALAGTEFTGFWSGEGTGTNEMGLTYPGCQIAIEMNQTNTRFSIQQSAFQCNGLSGNFGTLLLDISGNDLLFNNEKVGSIEAGHVNLRHSNPEFNTYFDLVIDNNALLFQETRFNAVNQDFYVNVTGKLFLTIKKEGPFRFTQTLFQDVEAAL